MGGTLAGCIRLATESDLGDVSAMESSIFGELGFPPFAVRHIYDISGHMMFVAVDDNVVCGYGMAALNPATGLGWLFGVAVLPRFRRRGYGTALTVVRMNALWDGGARELRTVIAPDDSASLRLHLNLGFQELGVAENYLGDGEDRMLMSTGMR